MQSLTLSQRLLAAFTLAAGGFAAFAVAVLGRLGEGGGSFRVAAAALCAGTLALGWWVAWAVAGSVASSARALNTSSGRLATVSRSLGRAAAETAA